MLYIHIATVVFALVLPLVSGLVPLKDGFIATDYPTVACLGRNINHIYYLFILPVSVFLTIASSLLVILFWILSKVRGYMQ